MIFRFSSSGFGSGLGSESGSTWVLERREDLRLRLVGGEAGDFVGLGLFGLGFGSGGLWKDCID